MVWTEITRPQYRREGMLYESDATDDEWRVMEPLLPPPSALGRPRETDMRALVNAILYIASTGCQWRQLPKEFPPHSTVQGYFWLIRESSGCFWQLQSVGSMHVRTLSRRYSWSRRP